MARVDPGDSVVSGWMTVNDGQKELLVTAEQPDDSRLTNRLNTVEHDVGTWLEQVVIGLNLCPFAATPYRNGQIRIVATAASNRTDLLTVVQKEIERLDQTTRATLETTLIVVTEMLSDFGEYNQFLDVVERMLRKSGWDTDYQVASFHPNYQFAGTDPADVANFTNRSPWPILHLLREDSLDEALLTFPDPESIPERNIAKVSGLSRDQLSELFPWIYRNQ